MGLSSANSNTTRENNKSSAFDLDANESITEAVGYSYGRYVFTKTVSIMGRFHFHPRVVRLFMQIWLIIED